MHRYAGLSDLQLAHTAIEALSRTDEFNLSDRHSFLVDIPVVLNTIIFVARWLNVLKDELRRPDTHGVLPSR